MAMRNLFTLASLDVILLVRIFNQSAYWLTTLVLHYKITSKHNPTFFMIFPLLAVELLNHNSLKYY